MAEDNDPISALSSGEVKVLPPDHTLKKAIGENVDIKEVFSEENIEKAQQSIDKHQPSFLEWAVNDVKQMEAHYKKASENPASCEAEIAGIEKVSDVLKSRGGTFNFGLASLVAKSLNEFCSAHRTPGNDHLIVIRKHIDTLSVIFSQNITGDGGAIGSELLENLAKLVNKYT